MPKSSTRRRKAPSYRIPSDHPVLPLVDWYLFLFDRARIGRRRFHGRRTCSAIKARLKCLRGRPSQPDIRKAATLLSDPSNILRLGPLLYGICVALDLYGADVKFPWSTASMLSHSVDATDLPWRLREEARFLSGTYVALPWADKLAPVPDHYAHLSTDSPGLIAFTQTADKGEADIQTPMKPGRYLAKFYPHLASHEVRDIQEMMPREAKVHFAVTADDIEKIYTTGPNSCMNKHSSDFDSPCHPVRVYGESDLQLAYITNKLGIPTARALVWPKKKTYGRAYGHQTLLTQQLEELGYQYDHLTGARIRRIDIDSTSVVMPYIDGDQSFDIIDADWLRIGGPFDAESTNGTASITPMTTCDHCDDRVSEDNTYHVDGEDWCGDCRDNYAFTSDFSGDLFPTHICERVFARRDDHDLLEDWSEAERDEHATYCSGSDHWYASADFEFVTLANGDTWLASYFKEHGNPANLPPDKPASETTLASDKERIAA